MAGIELKVSGIDPPSVIMDVVNLPDPLYLGFTILAYNYDDVALYFQITGSGTGWTFSTVNLGSIASGGNLVQNLDNFCNRARPASQTSEQIQLILKAYTDAGYSNLKWTYNKTLDVLFIKSDDGSWTTDFLNNFDDGTIQGWAVANEYGNDTGYPTVGVVTDYVLSPPYSLKARGRRASGLADYVYSRLYKSFTTPNRANVYAIMDLRIQRITNYYVGRIQIQRDGTVLVSIGKLSTVTDQIPRAKWMRLIAPLPANTTLEVRIVFVGYITIFEYIDLWMDDFRIISKD